MSRAPTAPSWVPDPQIVLAQLASGILQYAEETADGPAFRLPYPANLQRALDRLSLLAWHQTTTPPASVVELLQWAGTAFADWPLELADADVDPEESLLVHGRPTAICEELGSLRGDVEGEMRENALIRAVMDRTRAAQAPASYVAFRRLLVEHPVLTALELDIRLADPELALVADQVRQAYPTAPPEAASDGVVRTCGGCRGLLLPLDDDRTWACEDDSCPDPGKAGPVHPAAEGVRWLRRELRTFITAPGRAELRIAQAVADMGVPVILWPDFDACDLSVFAERPWVADVKAWRNPTRLGRALRNRMFSVPADADRAFVVIGQEQVRAQQRYIERLRRACPAVRPGQPVLAVSEKQFLDAVRRRVEGES